MDGWIFRFFAPLGLVCGVAGLAAAAMMYREPAQHKVWGTIALLFALVSIANAGGFVIGMVLLAVGGALGIAWEPRPVLAPAYAPAYAPAPYVIPVAPWRLCMGCGRWIPWAANVCPLCGSAAPVPPWAQAAPAVAAAAPPTAPPAPERTTAPCPTCTGTAEWYPAVRRWFCPAEQRYF